MDQLSKRVDDHGKKIENHDARIIKLEKESARTVESVKTLWNNDKELKECIKELTDSMKHQSETNIKLSLSIDKIDARLAREEKETEKRGNFKDSIITKIVFGILAVLGAGLCTLTLLGIIEWVRQIK